MPPYEEWRYAYIEGVGTNIVWKFADIIRTGEYRLLQSTDGGPFNSTDLKVGFFANRISLAAEGRQPTMSSPFTISIPLSAGPGPATVIGQITNAAQTIEQIFQNVVDSPARLTNGKSNSRPARLPCMSSCATRTARRSEPKSARQCSSLSGEARRLR
jgi:hypothetical protein